MIPTSRPTSSLTARIRRTFSACSSGVPWAKLSRKTSTPASKSSRSTSGELLAGPTVATILVRRAFSNGVPPGATRLVPEEGIRSVPRPGWGWARVAP